MHLATYPHEFMLHAELMIMAIHQTFSGQLWHLTSQTKLNLLYIISGEVNECIIGKPNVWTIFNPYHKHCMYVYNSCLYTIVTGFWKTHHFVTFDIIYISVYLRHSRWYYWFSKWLNQSHTTWNYYLSIGYNLKVCTY